MGLSFISNRQRRKEGTFCASAFARIKPTPASSGRAGYARLNILATPAGGVCHISCHNYKVACLIPAETAGHTAQSVKGMDDYSKMAAALHELTYHLEMRHPS
jgi:hypothetical protein